MLPEQYIRDFFGSWPPSSPPTSDYLAYGCAFSGVALDFQPRTLTGDDWRAACEVRDREADAALDAVY